MTAIEDQARSLFLAALDRGPDQWPAFLDGASGGDARVRARAEELLCAHREMGSIHPGRGGGADGPPDLAVAEHPGTVVGPYKLLEQVGEGGFGVVFLAEQAQPVRRKVALKVLKPGMDTRQVVARFEAERQALAMMDHPHIAKVFDGGETASGRPYFVMELVRGVPVTDFCDRNRLTPRQRLELFLSVCSAVQHAHQKGVIHRDLKPSNVLVSRHDTTPVVKVIDFGVAKALGQELTDKTLFTGVAQMVGTPMYMSPEQAGMSDLDVDTRSDIYSLGVLLYELLTGTTPFAKERFKTAGYDEIRRIIREEEPPKPSTRLSTLGQAATTASADRGTELRRLSAAVRGELDWIVMKALEKDRTRRYETVGAFAADVQRYLADEPVLACPPSAAYRVRKFARRNRGPVLAGSLVVLALVIGVVGTTWGMVRADAAWAEAVTEAGKRADALRDKDAALTAAGLSKRDADEKLFASYLDQARALRVNRRPGQRFEGLAAVRRATELARTLGLPDERFQELRDAAAAALALPDLHPVGPWVPWPADAYAIDFGEAHALYARTDRRGNCSVRRVADDGEVHHLPGYGAPAMPLLSPDGEFLAVTHFTAVKAEGKPNTVEVWKLGPTAALKILSDDKAGGPVFHPHLPQVAVVYTDGAIGLFDLPGGGLLRRLPPVTLTREVGVALHPTEPVAAVYSWFKPVVLLRDLNTGAVLAELPQDGRPWGVAWHPDGRTVAVGQRDPDRIRLYDRTALRVVRTIESNAPAPVAFNPAGDRLASYDRWSGLVELSDVGTGQSLFADGPSLMMQLHFSRDGRRLSGAVRDGKLGSWQVGDGREYRTLVRQALPEKARFEYSASVSPDGRLAAAAMTDGIGLWDLASGSELAFIPMPNAPGNRVRFEPSGALLVLSATGLSRWPIGQASGAAGQWVVGPPERLPLPRGSALGQSGDGRVIVTCSRAVDNEQPHAGGWVLHADRPDRPIRLDPGTDIAWIAVSPDGRYVVTSVHQTGLAKVWDARDGRPVKQLAEYGAGYPHFSPDGRWLSTEVDGGRVFAVGTWEPGPRLGGAGTFAPDGKLVVVPAFGRGDRLVDPATGQTLATLADPELHPQPIFLPVFTPDGTRLIGVGTGKGVRVWDLRLIREHLAEMGLDWDAPPYPPVDPVGKVVPPPRVEVRLGDPAQLTRLREEEARRIIEQCRRSVERKPDSAAACNNLAWIYLTAPEAVCDLEAALPLAEKAARLDPVNRTTLGLAYYRAGRYREAVEVVRANLDRQENWGLAFDLYVLAMSCHKLGETARARDYYDWAVRWPRTHKQLSSRNLVELDMFRAEASELLGVAVGGGVEIAPPPRAEK
jgi:serine/threonine protein kinase/WD40 repeat protein